MKSKLLFAFLIAAALGAAPAVARDPVPIIDYPNIAVATSSGKPLQVGQVKQAIQTAAAAKGWSIGYQADGKLLATLMVRGKHTIVVEIPYAVDKYSLIYKDSTNMKYAPSGKPMDNRDPTSMRSGTGHTGAVIHPYYNRWVQELKEAIRLELLRA
jgi:hypothetical protein